jgi:F5/8 type C domain
MRSNLSSFSHPIRIRVLSVIFQLAALVWPTHGSAQTVRVDATPGHEVNTFSPLYALGSTVDRVPSNATDVFFRPDQIKQVLSAGWGVISYRQNTDLFVQAWHWNLKGTWSDPAGKGYFTGDATPTNEMIRHSYGYTLRHRGFTRNGGTEFDGFSRLDDGDLQSYWKSNPYLTKEFTGEDDSLHPQWVVIALEKKEDINAIRIAWAEPYAQAYEVQYWLGDGDAMDDQDKGTWKPFASGTVTDGKGGTATLRLDASAVATKYVRVLMTRSSNTCDTHGSTDRRNCVGYAIRELYLGTIGRTVDKDKNDEFKDLLRHSPDQKQTLTLCSSVDPWHEPSDLYLAPDRMESGDQPGFDLFFNSGITRGLPAIVPVAMLYSTPEDAAAQMTYIKKRGYPVSYIEMGEEPDGQYMQPEDYAALYLQFATALHQVDRDFKLGGPVFEGVTEDIKVWPDAQGRTSWLGRFLAYLRSHQRIQDLAFMSFEHYPYDGCETPWENLYQEPELITHIMKVWRDDGLPPGIPLLDTETNDHGGEAAVDIFGALWLADSFGGFLSAGGKSTHYYHALSYSPPHPACANSWGTYHMFMVDDRYEIQQKTAQFFAAQLMTQEWAEPKNAEHKLYAASSDVKDSGGHVLVTAYALHRPDGQWSLMLINKDHDHPHQLTIVFHEAGTDRDTSFLGPIAMITFGKAQYQWHAARKKGYADPDGPPATSQLTGGENTVYNLPAASITVLRGRLGTVAK